MAQVIDYEIISTIFIFKVKKVMYIHKKSKQHKMIHGNN